MNGFAQQGLDEAAFSEKDSSGVGGLRGFDAFPKIKPTYSRRSTHGGYATIFLVSVALLLSLAEILAWHAGDASQQFAVERGVGHEMQINLDAVIAMPCADLHVNVQDAAGDRILAADVFARDPTSWAMWVDPGKVKVHHERNKKERRTREQKEREDTRARHVVEEVRRGGGAKTGTKKFPRTPRLRRGMKEDACRMYGSLEVNKVQGDFHITARGHGYHDFFGQHVAHETFNFSHVISELSFGPLYPSLLNPLDRTLARTPEPFNRFQYYVSVVPTIFTTRVAPPPSSSLVSAAAPVVHDRGTIRTNQYAVTSSSRPVPERNVPGVFFKYDIEPILLTVRQARRPGGLLALAVRIVNVVSGVLVGGGWVYAMGSWARSSFWKRRGGRGMDEGMLSGRLEEEDEGYTH